MRPLATPADLDAALAAPVALLYKHSGRCPISLLAYEEIEEVEARRPDVPVWMVEVVGQRPLSLEVARRLAVIHHSPQIILLVRGEPVWEATHFRVRSEDVVRELDAAMAELAG